MRCRTKIEMPRLKRITNTYVSRKFFDLREFFRFLLEPSAGEKLVNVNC